MPTYSHEELDSIITAQLFTLNRHDCVDRSTVGQIRALGVKLREGLHINRIDRSNIPLLVVLPFAMVPLEEQLKMVRYSPNQSSAVKPAFTYLDGRDIQDEHFPGEPVPTAEPYLILNVEDGGLTLGKSPNYASVEIGGFGRRPVTAEQGLALAIHCSQVFDRHNIHLSGSEIRDEQTEKRYSPDLWVYGGRVKMKRDSIDASDPRWGTPSWEKIVTL